MAITASLSGTALPALEVPFVQTPIENGADVQTLSGDVYTDFVSQEKAWSLSWASLTQTQYNAIRAIYDLQFTAYQYPTLSIPYYSVSSVPVRMTINDKDIWNNCGEIQNVTITLRETSQLPAVS